MNKAIFSGFIVIIVLLGGYYLTSTSRPEEINQTLQETLRPEESVDENWWLILGGLMNIEDDSWSTIHGELKATDSLRKKYLRTNPLDTDNGYHPQNVFKLVSRKDSHHSIQEITFSIDKYNQSRSPNRNASSGVFIIENYKDIDNFYQIGLEIDGKAVIKKKINGIYSTLGEIQLWGENDSYDNDSKPNLIPENQNVNFRIEKNQTDNALSFKFFLKDGDEWKLIQESIDTKEILPPGKVGIRSDFMDLTIKDYLLDNVSAVRHGANWQ
jgi:hypothetical protein